MMTSQTVLLSFDNAFRNFRETVHSLSDDEFNSTINGRTVSDIVAHLIGWNGLMIESSASILEGNAPSYYADAPYDYSHINAGFMAKYSSRSKKELIGELDSTQDKLVAYILALPAGELTADHHVNHYSGEPATVAGIINSLAGDYQFHTREIAGWFGKQDS